MASLCLLQRKALLSSEHVLGYQRKERLTTIENGELVFAIMTTSASETKCRIVFLLADSV